MIGDGDRLLVVPGPRIGRRVLSRGHDIERQIFVGNAIAGHVGLVPERVDLGWRIEPEGEMDVLLRRTSRVASERLTKALAGALVESAIDQDGIRSAGCNGR